jgi:DMSO reductase anchor subunit
MKTVPRWNHWSPPVLFLGYGLAGGALLTGRVSVVLWLLPLVGIVQIVAWVDQDRRERLSATTIDSATGLGQLGRVRAFEAPHTGENYLTKEMAFRVARKHVAVLKVAAVFMAAGLPVLLLLLPFNHLFAGLAALSHVLGVLIQRWVFFAEARHVVSLYYGR